MQNVQPRCFLWAAIISTTFMLAPPATASESQFVFVPRADSPGNDYLRVDNSSLEECERKCGEQGACNAFTYNQLHGVCFLKRAASRVHKVLRLRHYRDKTLLLGGIDERGAKTRLPIRQTPKATS